MPHFPRTAARSAVLAASLGLAAAFLAPLAGPVPAAVAAPSDEPATAAPEGAGASPEQGAESGGAGGPVERSGADGVGADRGAGEGAGTTAPSGGASPLEAAPAEGTGASPQAADGYDFPGNGGPTRIHVLSTSASDAILVESGGVFGMIDGSEGNDAPDGSDPRYPLRPGITPPSVGNTEWVLDYMESHGVTTANLAFYLGTHAHSDHIDNADEIIHRFHPKVILSPEYSDKWITDERGLWDNQYVYDRLVQAAQWAVGDYGARFVQHVDHYNTRLRIGDAGVQIIPFDPDEDYKVKGTTDANNMGWGAKVTAFGHSAFLAADLMDTESDWETRNGIEDRVAAAVGKVDLLKAGHHGLPSSNFENLLTTLAPSAIAQTGLHQNAPDRLSASVINGSGARWYPMGNIWELTHIPALVATFTARGLQYTDMSAASWGHEYRDVSPRAWWFRGGAPSATTGWWRGQSGNWYYFQGSPSSVRSQWVRDKGKWYWMREDGSMAPSGWVDDGNAQFYLDANGNPTASGWTRIDGAWYLLADGRARTGWVQVGASWYYLDPADGGAMATGWARDSKGVWYSFDSSGAMRSSQWVRTGSQWYRLGADGAMVTGWAQVGASWYYLDPAGGGAMVTGDAVINGKLQRFDASGRWLG